MNRRQFIRNLAGIGVFSILPGAGRVWKATRPTGIAYWLQSERHSYCFSNCYLEGIFQKLYELKEARPLHNMIEIVTDRETAILFRKYAREHAIQNLPTL